MDGRIILINIPIKIAKHIKKIIPLIHNNRRYRDIELLVSVFFGLEVVTSKGTILLWYEFVVLVLGTNRFPTATDIFGCGKVGIIVCVGLLPGT